MTWRKWHDAILWLDTSQHRILWHKRVFPDTCIGCARDSDRHQLVVGTNSGVLRNCYMVVFGENPCRKGQTEVHPTCAKIYRDFELSRKIRPDGSIGVIKLNHRGILIVPASSMNFVAE